jgi:pimeloyl-ACP methyl ester carboxylesterase
MKRLLLLAALGASFGAAAPAGACAADDTCLKDPLVATVSGEVWWDLNANGVRDGDEHPAYGGVAVVWADYDHDGRRQKGEPLVQTERDGQYTLPVDTRRTADGTVDVRREGGRPDLPADNQCLGGADGCKRTIAVEPGADVAHVDFPTVAGASLRGTIWDDKNDNGRREAGEGGVPGLRTFLDDNGDGKLTSGETHSSPSGADGGWFMSVPTRYQVAGGALPPLVLERKPGVDCSGPDDCTVRGLHTRTLEITDAGGQGVARPAVIFIHGYGGARIGCPNMNLWFALPYPHLDELRLGADGKPLRRDAGGTECTERAGVTGLLMDVAGSDIYGGASKHFDDITWPGRHFDYVWDWRRSPDTAVAGLDALVDKVRSEVGVAKVQIVAHSMGGLVTREYLDAPARAAKVQRVATVGTPYWGSPKTIFPLTAGVEVPFGSVMDGFMNNAWLKAASRTFPGHFALVPSLSYGPWLTVKGVQGGKALDPAGIAEYLEQIGVDPAMYASGASEHARVLDHYDDHGVDYQVIVGGGLPTPGSVSITPGLLEDRFDVEWVSGDETVPARSGAHDTPSDRLHYVCGISHVPLTTAEPTTRLVDPFIIRGEPMEPAGGECEWSGRELTVYHLDNLARASAGASAPRITAGGRTYALRDAERAGLVQAITIGDETKIVAMAKSGVRVDLPGDATATVRTLTEAGAGREQRFTGATAVDLGGTGAATRNGKALKPAAKDAKPPVTKATLRGRRLTLRARDNTKVAATYVIVGGRARRYRKPVKLTPKQLRSAKYASVDIWGNAEKPRRVR